MANERNRDGGKHESPSTERDKPPKLDPAEIAAADANEEFEPNDLGEAERVFEETHGGQRPHDA